MRWRLLSLCKRCISRPNVPPPHPSPAARRPLPPGSHNSSPDFSTLGKITVLFSLRDQLPISCGRLTSTGCRSKITTGCLMSGGLSEVGPFWGPQSSWEKKKRTEESRRLKRLQLPPRMLTAVRLVVNEVRRAEWRVRNKS